MRGLDSLHMGLVDLSSVFKFTYLYHDPACLKNWDDHSLIEEKHVQTYSTLLFEQQGQPYHCGQRDPFPECYRQMVLFFKHLYGRKQIPYSKLVGTRGKLFNKMSLILYTV